MKTDLDSSGTRYTHLVLPYKPELLDGSLTQQLWEAFDVYTLLTLDKIGAVEVRRCYDDATMPQDVKTYSCTYGQEAPDGHEAPPTSAGRLAVLQSGSEIQELMVSRYSSGSPSECVIRPLTSLSVCCG